MLYRNMLLHNVSEIAEEEKGLLITRLPESLRVTLNKSALLASRASAGCEMRFNLLSRQADITLCCEGGSGGIAEVYQGSFLTAFHFIGNTPSAFTVSRPANVEALKTLSRKMNLPFDSALTRVVLPYHVVRIIDIRGEFSPPEPYQLPGLNFLAYGSSITHGSMSFNPSSTYIMRAAAKLGVNLFNLGFGGGAHYENQMADYIAGRNDWDFASFEIGINMIGSFDVEEFRKRVEYFLGKVVEKHPGKYIFCIDIFSFYRDIAGSDTDKHERFRKVVRKAVKKINSEKVIHLDGRKLLKDPTGLGSDLLHPASSGMEEIAVNLSREMGKKIRKA